MIKIAIVCVLLGLQMFEADAHGRMMEPPARNSMWRVGFDTPANYNDMGLNCGGASTQWNTNNGDCGLCGDPYNGNRDHEAGGIYAPLNRPIPRCYSKDQGTIPVSIRITAYHKGYFQFFLCVNNDLAQDPDNDECITEENLLTVAGTSGLTKYDINGNEQEVYDFALNLPDKECSQCVLQWKYNTGNSWGCDAENDCGIGKGPQEQFINLQKGNSWGCDAENDCGIGKGPQEQFINCADVAILEDCEGMSTVVPPATQNPPQTENPALTTDRPIVTNAPATYPPTQQPGSSDVICTANAVYQNVQGLAEWCKAICREPLYLFCPQTHCYCYKY